MKKLLVVAIFFIFVFFRFYNLEQRIGFDWDQEKFSSEIRAIVIDHKPTLIGPRTNNDLGFFLGPYFNYLLSPFYYFTNGDPIAMYYFIILFAPLFFILSFFVLNRIFGFWQACLFMFWWSINYSTINYDSMPWWPVLIPLGVILSWQILKKIYLKNKLLDWFYIGVLIGVFSNFHFQFVLVAFFIAVFLILYLFDKKKLYLKNILASKLGFLITFFPLLIFDLRHDFLNLKLFINFFFSKESQITPDRNVWWTVFANFLQPFIYYENILLTQFFYLLILFISIFLIYKSNKFNRLFFKAFSFLWITFPIFFMLYGKRPSEYYFLFLIPFIFIVLIYFADYFKKKLFLLFFVICIFALTISDLNEIYKNTEYGLYQKNLLVKKIKEIAKNDKIDIYVNTDLGRNYGFSYLIQHHKIVQENNPNNPHYEITFPLGRSGKDDYVFGVYGLKVPKKL